MVFKLGVGAIVVIFCVAILYFAFLIWVWGEKYQRKFEYYRQVELSKQKRMRESVVTEEIASAGTSSIPSHW